MVMNPEHMTDRQAEGFFAKVWFRPGCWEWSGDIATNGYGSFRYGPMAGGQKQKVGRAHRLAWELFVGPIPNGLVIDHLCRNRRCVNPNHLEPVTHSENLLRGSKTNGNTFKTHCKRGHEFTEENTYRYPSGKKRQCLTCKRDHYPSTRRVVT